MIQSIIFVKDRWIPYLWYIVRCYSDREDSIDLFCDIRKCVSLEVKVLIVKWLSCFQCLTKVLCFRIDCATHFSLWRRTPCLISPLVDHVDLARRGILRNVCNHIVKRTQKCWQTLLQISVRLVSSYMDKNDLLAWKWV